MNDMDFEEEDFSVPKLKSHDETAILKETNNGDEWIIEKILGIRMGKRKVIINFFESLSCILTCCFTQVFY